MLELSVRTALSILEQHGPVIFVSARLSNCSKSWILWFLRFIDKNEDSHSCDMFTKSLLRLLTYHFEPPQFLATPWQTTRGASEPSMLRNPNNKNKFLLRTITALSPGVKCILVMFGIEGLSVVCEWWLEFLTICDDHDVDILIIEDHTQLIQDKFHWPIMTIRRKYGGNYNPRKLCQVLAAEERDPDYSNLINEFQRLCSDRAGLSAHAHEQDSVRLRRGRNTILTEHSQFIRDYASQGLPRWKSNLDLLRPRDRTEYTGGLAPLERSNERSLSVNIPFRRQRSFTWPVGWMAPSMPLWTPLPMRH